MAPIHDRQMVIVNCSDRAACLDNPAEGELLQPLPAGSLEVEQVSP